MSTDRPLFSVITPVYEPPVSVLRDMIDSVRHQRFGDWELVLVDDVSPSDEVRDVLREAAQADRRITVVERTTNGGIVAASNDAVDRARGEFLVLVDHDDLLTADALEVMARAIEADPNADYLYSDEDKVDADGRFYDLFRKPDWSPERLRGQMYTGHLSVMRTALVRQVGAFRAGFDGSQDHDLALRVSEQAGAVVHVPEVLLPLAGGARLGGRRSERQTVRLGRWPERGGRPPRTGGHRRHGRLRTVPRLLPGPPPAGPGHAGQRDHPDRGQHGAGLGATALLRGRGGPLGAGQNGSSERGDRRRLRHAHPSRGARRTAGRGR